MADSPRPPSSSEDPAPGPVEFGHAGSDRREAVGLTLAVIAGAACLTPWIGPPIALAMGVALAVIGLTPPTARLGKLSKIMIQVGVVLLGFRMDLHKVAEAGLMGVAFALGTIVLTIASGMLLARMLRVDRVVTTLVSNGTAICGGSAIAATGPMIGAGASQMAVAMGSVFILNAIGLFIFPPLGRLLELTPHQFGTWAAIAVHDISSVVGSAAAFDKSLGLDGATGSLETATAVKLSRALWIAPVALAAAWWHRRIAAGSDSRTTPSQPTASRRRPPIPWFIGLFILASILRTLIPEVASLAPSIEAVAKKVLTVALLLIGLGMSPKAIASVGWRALALALALWVIVGISSLMVIRSTVD